MYFNGQGLILKYDTVGFRHPIDHENQIIFHNKAVLYHAFKISWLYMAEMSLKFNKIAIFRSFEQSILCIYWGHKDWSRPV